MNWPILCPEHTAAARYLQANWARQDFALCELVLVELYVLLRSSAVLSKPLSPGAALKVDYPGNLMNAIWKEAEAPGFPVRGVFDARLAHTLLHHGVREFATRNTKHFQQFGFETLLNPIDG